MSANTLTPEVLAPERIAELRKINGPTPNGIRLPNERDITAPEALALLDAYEELAALNGPDPEYEDFKCGTFDPDVMAAGAVRQQSIAELTAERDRLRAEVARLKEECRNHMDLSSVPDAQAYPTLPPNDEEVEDRRAINERARQANARRARAVVERCVDEGAFDHDDECPGDDTCDGQTPGCASVAAVNEAHAGWRAATSHDARVAIEALAKEPRAAGDVTAESWAVRDEHGQRLGVIEWVNPDDTDDVTVEARGLWEPPHEAKHRAATVAEAVAKARAGLLAALAKEPRP